MAIAFLRDEARMNFQALLQNWEWKKEILITVWTFMIIFAPFLFA